MSVHHITSNAKHANKSSTATDGSAKPGAQNGKPVSAASLVCETCDAEFLSERVTDTQKWHSGTSRLCSGPLKVYGGYELERPKGQDLLSF